jgi:anti-sigma regulatory factor (Ser/Thr protein kinase)
MEALFAFAEESLHASGLGSEPAAGMMLAIEELFTNMVKYNGGGSADIAVTIGRESDRIIVRLVDSDAEPFDITRAAPVDLSAPLEERPVGGLGIHLVRSMVDTIEYSYDNRCSTIILTKNLERDDVRDRRG